MGPSPDSRFAKVTPGAVYAVRALHCEVCAEPGWVAIQFRVGRIVMLCRACARLNKVHGA